MKRPGLHNQKYRPAFDQAESVYRGGGNPHIKFFSRKYREHGLTFKEVDRPNRTRHVVARGDAFRFLGCDDDVVGADANLQRAFR